MRKFITDILAKANLGVEQNAYVLGYMGIGTSSASQKLEVSGGDALIRNAFIGLISSYGVNYASFSHTSRAGAAKYSFLSSNAGDTYVNSANGQPVYFRHENTDNAIITADGKLGIGTTSPSAKLHVNGTFISNALWTNASSIAFWGAHDSAYGGLTWDTGQATVYATSGNKLYLASNGSSPDMTIDTNGNVGIGTSSPNSKLVVRRDVTDNDLSQYGRVQLEMAGSSDSNKQLLVGFETENNYGFIQTLAFGTSWESYNLALQWKGGNVGIGTKSPGYKLSVAANGNSYNISPHVSGVDIYSTGNIAPHYQTNYWWFTGVPGSGTFRMGLDSSGNLGIGTSSPSQKLHVEGNAIIAGNVGIGTTNPYSPLQVGNFTGTGGFAYGTVATFAGTWSALRPTLMLLSTDTVATQDKGAGIGFGINSEAGSTPYTYAQIKGLKEVAGGGYSGYMAFYTTPSGSDANTERMRINSLGNVGIGTSSPQTFLTLNGANVSYVGQLQIASNDYAQITFYNSSALIPGSSNRKASLIYNVGGNTFEIANQITNGHLILQGSDSGGGNVGIGTDSPGNKLTVNGNTRIVTPTLGGLFAYDAPSGGSFIWALTRYTDTSANDLNVNTLSGFGVRTGVSGLTTSGHQFYVTSGGNVGIGTTSPGYKLEVNGNVYGSTTAQFGTGYIDGTQSGWAIFGSNSSSNGIKIVLDGSVLRNDIVVATSGLIGIGTGTPTERLHVSGNLRVTGAYYDSNNSAGTSGQVLSSTGSGTDWVSLSEIAGVDGTGTANYLPKWLDADTIGNSVIYQNGSNIGIGVTNADYPLTVSSINVGDVGASLGIVINSVISTAIPSSSVKAIIGVTNSGFGYAAGSLLLQPRTGVNGVLAFATEGSEKMRITYDGSVGIGTTSPSLESAGIGLDILNSSYTQLRVQSSSSSAGIEFKPSSGDRWEIQANTSGQWFVYNRTDSQYRLLIDNNGYIGIGTNNPATKLEVFGGHGDTTARLYSVGNGSGLDASLDMWASEPGVTYTGSGIGNNVNGHPYYGRRNSSLPQSYIRFYDGEVILNTGSTTSSPTLTVKANGNVGIGTTSPSDKLDVLGNVNVYGYKIYNGVSNNSAGLDLDGSRFNIYGYYGIVFNSSNAGIGSQSERMRITPSGNIGIGTSNPSTALEVNGTITSTGTLTAYTAIPSINIGHNGDSAFIASTSGNGANTPISFSVGNNAEKMRITSSGNVGIGTSSPAAKLDIVGSGSGLALSFGTTVPNNPLFINTYGGWSGIGMDQTTAGIRIVGDFSSKLLDVGFYTGGVVSHANWVPKLVVLNTGNVGIGTTSPTAPLDTNGVRLGRNWAIANRADIRLDSNGPDYPADILFGHTAAANQTGWDGVYWSISSRASSLSNAFTIWRGSGNPGGAGEEVLFTILPNGNIGIGTTSPSYKLSVESSTNTSVSISSPSGYQTALELKGTDQWYRLISQPSSNNYRFDIYNQTLGAYAFSIASNSDAYLYGRVGIGTTNPYSNLQIQASSNTRLLVQVVGTEAAGDNAGLYFKSAVHYSDAYIKGAVLFSNNGTGYGRGDLILATNNAGDSTNVITSDSKLIIKANGNVGIGTTSPAYKLDIAGSARVSLLNSYYTYTEDYGIGTPDSAGLQVFAAGGDVIRFGHRTTGTFTERMRITSGGNILMNTAASTTTGGFTNTTLSVKQVADGLFGGGLHIEENATTSVAYFGFNGDTFRIGTSYRTTGNYRPISFATNGLERLRIDNAGNVGIGTTAPGAKLDIVSTGSGSEGLRVDGSSGGFAFVVKGGSDYTSHIRAGATIGVNYFVTPPSNGLIVEGNVGIGTTSPSEKLHVVGKGIFESNVRIYPVSESWAEGLSFIMPTTSNWGGLRWQRQRVNNDGNWYIGFTALDSTDDLVFGANNGGSQVNNIIRLTKAGYVGIGTASPDQPLAFADAFGAKIQLNGNNSNGYQIGLIPAVAGGDAMFKFTAGEIGSGEFGFYNTTNLRMLITAAGNVGIGTTSPEAKLHIVSGSGQAGFLSRGTSGDTWFPYSNGQNYVRGITNFDSGSVYFTGGNVGIGTASSSAKLDISVTPSAAWMNLINGDETAFRLTTYNNGTNNGSAIYSFKHGLYYNTIENAAITFYRGGSTVGGFLTFTTNNGAERMRIDSNGNVGIGTTSPASKLDVFGEGRFNVSAAGNTTTAALTLVNTTDDVNNGVRIGWKPYNASFETAYITTIREGANAFSSLVFATSTNGWGVGGPSERMRITSAGNVGIGTTSPATKLVVESGGFAVQGLSQWPSSGFGLEFWNLADTSYIGSFNRTTSAYRNMFLFANNTIFENGGNERMRITSAGNIGIGTTSPGARLHVEGGNAIFNNGLADTILAIETDAAGLYDPIFQMGSGQNSIASEGFEIWYSNNVGDVHLSTTYSDAAASIRFHTATGTSKSTSNERMIITGTGNVGIGTTSPAYKLHVEGNVSGISIYASHDIAAFSDITVKKEVKKIENAIEKVKELNGYTYVRTDDETGTRRAGVIAQEVQKVLPEVVSANPDGTLNVAYSNMIALLIEGMKEQQKEIDELKKLLKK